MIELHPEVRGRLTEAYVETLLQRLAVSPAAERDSLCERIEQLLGVPETAVKAVDTPADDTPQIEPEPVDIVVDTPPARATPICVDCGGPKKSLLGEVCSSCSRRRTAAKMRAAKALKQSAANVAKDQEPAQKRGPGGARYCPDCGGTYRSLTHRACKAAVEPATTEESLAVEPEGYTPSFEAPTPPQPPLEKPEPVAAAQGEDDDHALPPSSSPAPKGRVTARTSVLAEEERQARAARLICQGCGAHSTSNTHKRHLAAIDAGEVATGERWPPVAAPAAMVQLPTATKYPRGRCQRCGGRLITSREVDGDETRCLTCGAIAYPEGFTPLDVELEGKTRRREPSMNGVRL